MTEANNTPDGKLVSNEAFYSQYYRMPAWVRREVMHMAHDWHTGDLVQAYAKLRRVYKERGHDVSTEFTWRIILDQMAREDTKDHIAAFPGLKAFMGQFPC